MKQAVLDGSTKGLADLTIVVPALNAGEALARLLDDLQGCHTIVVDGGSTDDTASVARRHGAEVVQAAKGRGTQLAKGAEQVTTNWLLFLHSDTTLGKGWREIVASFMTDVSNRSRVAVFTFRLDDEGRWPRLVEKVVKWRTLKFGLPYGDQGLLIHRSLYDEIGGYASHPLMEDVDIARRLGRRRIVLLPTEAVTSARRYQRDGYLRRTLRNLTCLMMYLAGVPPARLLRFYEK